MVPVPKVVAARLSLYARELQHLVQQGQSTINSAQLGKRLGVTDAQVRKDLANFGQFGYPGIGYRCGELADQIRRILGTTESWAVVLVGVGNLGTHCSATRGLRSVGFRIVAAVDIDADKVGREVASIRGPPDGRAGEHSARARHSDRHAGGPGGGGPTGGAAVG